MGPALAESRIALPPNSAFYDQGGATRGCPPAALGMRRLMRRSLAAAGPMTAPVDQGSLFGPAAAVVRRATASGAVPPQGQPGDGANGTGGTVPALTASEDVGRRSLWVLGWTHWGRPHGT
jgi:hypothetical protein